MDNDWLMNLVRLSEWSPASSLLLQVSALSHEKSLPTSRSASHYVIRPTSLYITIIEQIISFDWSEFRINEYYKLTGKKRHTSPAVKKNKHWVADILETSAAAPLGKTAHHQKLGFCPCASRFFRTRPAALAGKKVEPVQKFLDKPIANMEIAKFICMLQG